MNRPCVLLFFLVLVPALSFAQGGSAVQYSLKELGYAGVEVQGVEADSCSEFVFSIPDPGQGFFPIISLNAAFYPNALGEAWVAVSLNGSFIGRFGARDFRCEEGCWARKELDTAMLGKENTLKVCLATGKSITRVLLSNESLIGYYKQPIFRPEDFRKCILLDTGECVESYNASLGEDLNITLSLLNSGTLLSLVDLNNRVEEAGTRPARKEIGGTHFEGVILPGKSASINYTIRVEKAVPMSLPPGHAVYFNAFGEKESLSSNLVSIYPKGEPELKATLGIESIDHSKKEAVLSFTVFNKERIELTGIQAGVLLGEGLELVGGKSEIAIDRLGPRQAFSAGLSVKAAEDGDYAIGCAYSLQELPEKQCEPVIVSFKEENPLFLVGAVIALVAIAAGIYFFLLTREEYTE